MKNNNIGKIAIATEGRENTLKNKSCDLHTTMDFGSVMPGKVQRVIPGSTIKVGTKERVLLTSLVAPTFGRMSLKAYHVFVPFSDLTRNFGPLMAREFVYRNNNSAFVPAQLPSIPINDLSLMVLFGSQMTIYRSYSATEYDLLQIPSNVSWNAQLGSLPQACQDCISDLGIDFGYSQYGLTNAARIPYQKLSIFGLTGTASLPFSNPNYCSFFDYTAQHPPIPGDEEAPSFGETYVSLEGADYIVPVAVEISQGVIHHYILAFRLSSFGRRLRKNLIGCGWQFNLDSDQPLSIMPLMAYFKAYFDVFGLTLYKNWEETVAYQILQWSDQISSVNWSCFAPVNGLQFRDFVVNEFGQTLFTDEQDFVSAHIRNSAVAPRPTGLIGSIVADVDGTNGFRPNIDVASINPAEANVNLAFPNGHAFVSAVNHGQLDSNLLKRLYRSTNAQTIAGRRIAELLRAQGLGAYMDEHKSNFIGSWSLDLNVYDLPSQSDTYQSIHDGMRLGEYGAFGKSSGEHPLVSYDTSEDGYFITLLVVVPKGGYSETVDPDMLCLTKYDQYNPIWDSLGYQYNRKMCTVQGSQPWKNQALNVGNLAQSFGLAPRDFFRKFGRNVMNGDFSLRSTRESYRPFCLERLIDVGEHRIEEKVLMSQQNLTRITVDPFGLNADNLPVAGDVWRYPTRYDWISRFNRIFYNDSSSVDQYNTFGVAFGSTAEYEFFSLKDDNFIVHIVFELNVYDQMLPVQDSFETSDDEKNADKMISKA